MKTALRLHYPELAIIISAICFLILLIVTPLFDPPFLFWGVNLIRYLPPIAILIPITSLLLTVYLLLRIRNRKIESIRKPFKKNYFFFIGILTLGIIAVANIDTLVLGDGENVLFDIIRGDVHRQGRSPLTFQTLSFLNTIGDWLLPSNVGDQVKFESDALSFTQHQRTTAEFSFTLLGFLLLPLFIYASFGISKIFFTNVNEQVLAALVILLSGYLPQFAGYVEIYVLPMTLLLLFYWSIFKTVENRKALPLTILLFVLMVSSHIGFAVFFPILGVTIYYSLKKKFGKALTMLLVGGGNHRLLRAVRGICH